jgi:competence protein ComEA
VRRFFLLMTLVALPPLLFSLDAMAEANLTPKAAAKPLFPLLPAGAGRDVMVRTCSQCHTPERAALERHDLDGWNDLIGVMQNNGAEASDEEFDQIAAYLAKAFPPGKPVPKNK